MITESFETLPSARCGGNELMQQTHRENNQSDLLKNRENRSDLLKRGKLVKQSDSRIN